MRISARAGGTGQNGNGINIFRAGNVMVTNNHVSDCAFSAIRANQASNIQIVSNQAIRSGETAIYAEFSFEGAVIASNLIDGGTVGISVANFNEGGRLASLTGNIIRNLSTKGPYPAEHAGFGIGIAIEADAAVSGNVIEGAPKWGVLMGWGPFLRSVNFTGNTIRNSGAGVAVSVVEGAGLGADLGQHVRHHAGRRHHRLPLERGGDEGFGQGWRGTVLAPDAGAECGGLRGWRRLGARGG
jgi:uncharacterized secreted repeat protein (TIGR03808 family)